MTNLDMELCRILDFPTHFCDKAFYEANNGKLNRTWLEVNGELMYVTAFNSDGTVQVENQTGDINNVLVNSLEVWNPETGVYQHGKGLAILKKRTAKQWKKSYCQNSYNFTEIKNVLNKEDFYKGIYKQKPKQFFIIENGEIYFFSKKVGTLSKGILKVKPLYEKEVIKFLNGEGIK